MPIAWRRNDTGRIDIVFADPYTIEQSEQAMREIFAHPEVPRPLRFLVDVRGSTPPDTEFIVNATTFWQLHIREMWDARVAVVTSSDRQEGMAQMSERSAAARELPFTVHVFREAAIDDAARWLARS